MDDALSPGLRALLDGVPAEAAARAAALLVDAPAVQLAPRMPYFRASFRDAAVLIVDEGFVIVRATHAPAVRSVITCEAGAGRVMLPPAPAEVLLALGGARVLAVPDAVRDRLLAVPGLATRLVEQLTLTLAQSQEGLGNFAQTRHVERVRQRLLQLARSYGHVVRDGLRIDFPISHALLAEMVGSSRETVTRALDQLERDGFVTRRGSTYQLLVSPLALDGDVTARTGCDGNHTAPGEPSLSIASR